MVERWRQSSPEDFWAEFSSDNGKYMTFTAISQHLRQSRLADDAKLAEAVKDRYGELFPDHFSYRRGGEVRVMVDATAIANRYRGLAGRLEFATEA